MVQPATAAVRLLSGEREPVRVATTANIELAGLQTVDGIALAVNDRVLVKNQTDARENGIYTSSTGRWSRASDASFSRAISAGITVQVVYGDTHGGQAWRFDTFMPNIGVDDILLNFYLSSDLVADAEAAVQNVIALATEQADRAEDAADLALSAVSGVIAPKATLALAIADDPALDPEYYDIAYFDTAYQTGSGAKWRKVVSNPGLVAGAAFQNANGAWYVNDAATLRPEQFGRCGVDAAGDTAAWVRLAAEANRRTRARVTAEGLYNIAGSTIVFDGSLQKLNLRLLNAEFYQQTTFSKTLRVENVGDVRVHGGYFEGLGGDGGEYNGASSSYNGVAAIYFLNCDKVWVSKCAERLHAGGGFVVQGGRVRRFENVDCEGIGPDYIDPIGDGHDGNGSDFAIMCQPSVNDATQLFQFEDRFINVRTFNHAFGVQTVATKSLFVRGCELGPHQGQHAIYAIDCDGLNVQTNTLRGCRQFLFKNQYENYAGRFMAPAWQAATAYAVGDRVIAFSFLYVCHTAHTSGGSFSSTNWNADPLNRRNGGSVSNNILDGEGQGLGLGFISTSLSDGRAIWTRNLVCKGNTFRNFAAEPIVAERMLDCDFEDNQFDGGGSVAMILRDYRGRVKGNTFRNCGRTPVNAALSGDIYYEDNLHIDCGLAGTAADSRVPSLVTFNRDGAKTIPDMPSIRVVNFRRNEIRYTGSSGSATLLFFGADTGTHWRISETRCNPGGSLLGRVDGTLLEQFRNDFSGYVNTAQNVPTFTITNWSTSYTFDANGATTDQADAVATMMSLLGGYRVIKTN